MNDDPQASISVITEEDGSLQALILVTGQMKTTFSKFPEVLFIDGTYCTNKLRLPLYTFVVEDGNGQGQPVAYSFVANEKKTTIQALLLEVKKIIDLEKVEVVVLDKDLKEIASIKSTMPEASIQICKFHVLQAMLREIRTLPTTESERIQLITLCKKLVYARTDEVFEDTLANITRQAPAHYIAYINKNWLPIKDYWANYLTNCHKNLGNTTNNRTESHNEKIKNVLSRNMSLSEAIKGLMLLHQSKAVASEHENFNQELKSAYRLGDRDFTTQQILQKLTPYAGNIVLEEMKQARQKSDMLSKQTCLCSIRKTSKLPCRHIFAERLINGEDLFRETDVGERWLLHYQQRTSNKRPAQKRINFTCTKKSKLSAKTKQEKYNEAMTHFKTIADFLSLFGTAEFSRRMSTITELYNLWLEGESVAVYPLNDNSSQEMQETNDIKTDKRTKTTSSKSRQMPIKTPFETFQPDSPDSPTRVTSLPEMSHPRRRRRPIPSSQEISGPSRASRISTLPRPGPIRASPEILPSISPGPPRPVSSFPVISPPASPGSGISPPASPGSAISPLASPRPIKSSPMISPPLSPQSVISLTEISPPPSPGPSQTPTGSSALMDLRHTHEDMNQESNSPIFNRSFLGDNQTSSLNEIKKQNSQKKSEKRFNITNFKLPKPPPVRGRSNIKRGKPSVKGNGEKENVLASRNRIINKKQNKTKKMQPTTESTRKLMDEILEESELQDKHINVASKLLKQKFVHVEGLQDPLLGQKLQFDICRGQFVQILHNNAGHWLCISNINIGTHDISDGSVYVYDSLYSSVSTWTKMQIASILNTPQDNMSLIIKRFQKQSGAVDCGLFAIAAAISICFGKDPSTAKYDQKKMRKHLYKCIEGKEITPFPEIPCNIPSTNNIKKSITVPLYCICRLPDNREERMIECCICSKWFHQTCLTIKREVFLSKTLSSSWICRACKQAR